MKVLPPIGLTKRPFRAAFISAYNAGLMPFFLHFFSSASLSPVVSKLLDFQSLLETDSCEPLLWEKPWKASSEGLPEDIVIVELDESERDRWSRHPLFSASRLSGVKRGSGSDLPLSFLIMATAVALFGPLPWVVVDADRIELLADDCGREMSEGVVGSGIMLAGGVMDMPPAVRSSS